MANYTPVPIATGAAVTPVVNTAAASDTYDVVPNGRYVLELAGGTPGGTFVIDDPNSVTPVGATQFNPDVSLVLAASAIRRYLLDANRFRDTTTGRITITVTPGTGVTHGLLGPL
jgi:hypothetical protein